MYQKFLAWALGLLLTVGALPLGAAARQPVSQAYIDSCFTTIAAASCLGIYLPESSTEFDYLRSYGWEIVPQEEEEQDVATHFAIASNYFPELDQLVYMVTFRGSASKGDWQLNLQTSKVNYGGSTLAEMESLAQAKTLDKAPAVHAGFNKYVDTVLRAAVVDEQGGWRGIFRDVATRDNVHLLLTGHSLGGAAATLLGERLASLGLPKSKFTVVTFGAPAIGNQEFVDTYGESIRLLRITNTADPVPGSLQTFFGGYKQFGEHIKYSISTQQSSLQHAMALYFDRSVSEQFKALDWEIAQHNLPEPPYHREQPGKPVVALWLYAPEGLQQLAMGKDISRFAAEQYKELLPGFVIMEQELRPDAYTKSDLLARSREAGADYMLVGGFTGSRLQQDNYHYLTLEQSLFATRDGRLLSMGSYGKKVAPAVGNIQAAGEVLWEARKDLQQAAPFIITEHQPLLLGSEEG